MTYTDVFGDSIELTDERWAHIVKEHPEVAPYRERTQHVLTTPDYVKQSTRDRSVLLYYRFYEDIFDGKYLLAVVKKGSRCFILTCFITDRIKEGLMEWEKK